jgi:hypothetical protein
MTFQATTLDFILTSLGPGPVNTDGTGLTIGGSCAIAAGSPFDLMLLAGGSTALSLNACRNHLDWAVYQSNCQPNPGSISSLCYKWWHCIDQSLWRHYRHSSRNSYARTQLRRSNAFRVGLLFALAKRKLKNFHLRVVSWRNYRHYSDGRLGAPPGQVNCWTQSFVVAIRFSNLGWETSFSSR